MGVSAMIYLGDRLGFVSGHETAHKSLDQCGTRAKTGLHERWLREWLRGQHGEAVLIDYKVMNTLSCRQRWRCSCTVLIVPSLLSAFSPVKLASAQRLWWNGCQSPFKTGLGLPYDARGSEGARGIERVFGSWFRFTLVSQVLPKLDGVVDKFTSGAKAADVGCSAGMALIQMAKAFPRTAFHGYDISQHALARAEENKRQANVDNVTFHNAKSDGLSSDSSFDFISTFDCIHDMTHPTEMIRVIRKAVKPDGTWFIADIKSLPTFEENLEKNPMTSLLYAFSVMGCMSSALSEPDGEGLGTLGFNEAVARRMTAEAGFSRFTRHDFENPLNAYYEVRP